MKTLSIRQPWAEMIRSGQKTIELRVWKTEYRGDLLICSGQNVDELMKLHPQKTDPALGVWCSARDSYDSDWENYYHVGQALFVAELYDVTPFTYAHQKASLCDYAPGYFSWHLRHIREIKRFPLKGRLRLFDTPNNLINLVE